MVSRLRQAWLLLFAYAIQLMLPLWHVAEHAGAERCASCIEEVGTEHVPALHAECPGTCRDPAHHHHHSTHDDSPCVICQSHGAASPHIVAAASSIVHSCRGSFAPSGRESVPASPSRSSAFIRGPPSLFISA